MTDFPELTERVASARQELREAEDALRDARLAACPFKVGDVVEARIRGVWSEARIARIELSAYSVRYRVNTRKKDGAWSSGERAVFDVKAVS